MSEGPLSESKSDSNIQPFDIKSIINQEKSSPSYELIFGIHVHNL